MQEEEIDLIKLFQIIKKSSFYTRIEKTIYFIFKNYIWFIAFLVIGGSVGYYFDSKIVPIYRSDMTVDSKALYNISCEQVVGSLGTLFTDRNYEELEKVGFPKELASTIQSVSFVYPDEESDSLRKIEPFRVVVYATVNDKFPEIESTLINFLRNNEYSLADEKTNITAYEQQKIELQTEITLIDSMQQYINAYLRQNKSNNEYALKVDLSALIIERTQAKMKLIDIDKKLNNISNFQVMKSMPPRLVAEPVHSNAIPKYAFLAFIVGGICLGLIKK